jgi:hypothetical protein
MISASQANFGLEELAGIDTGAKGKGLYNEPSKFEILLNSYETFNSSYEDIGLFCEWKDRKPRIDRVNEKLDEHLKNNKVDISKEDISELIEYVHLDEIYKDQEYWGPYIGSLISILTKKNENAGKRTVIEINENRIDHLGEYCTNFDVIKIKTNYGKMVFADSENGNLLYVQKENGGFFANGAGGHGKINAIVAEEVNEKYFADFAGNYGKIGIIAVKKMNGEESFQEAVHDGELEALMIEHVKGDICGLNLGHNGNTGLIFANVVDGKAFAANAGASGRIGAVIINKANGLNCARSVSSDRGAVVAKEINNTGFGDGILQGIYNRLPILKNHIYKKCVKKYNPKELFKKYELDKFVPEFHIDFGVEGW